VSGSDRISPTAHYTGYVWARNGLAPPELATVEGRLLYESLRATMALSAALGGNAIEPYLLARHRALDLLLSASIDSGQVSQVIEVACGLSPRGWRFHGEYGDRLDYVEADLPGMAVRKRAALARTGSLDAHHRVVAVDALRPAGPGSLAELAATLDPGRGTAIITEGLTGYLDRASLTAMWRGFARTLSVFPSGSYLSDLHLGEGQDLQIRAFRLLLSVFVRGDVHLHFADAVEAAAVLLAAGFDNAELIRAAELIGPGEGRGEQLVHIIEASTVDSQ
jgi:O-methyltransferase involved in polyketide biosynthesis